MKKIVIGSVIMVMVIAIVVIRMQNPGTEKPEITVFKSLSCGCCGVYVDYMKRDFKVKIVNTEDTVGIKDNYGVPAQLRSCHTTVMGNYFAEGHIPREAVKKLMDEQPDIKGIAMPGMPSGSPGMPGSKKGPFIIYQVNRDGSYSEYMRI